MKKVAYQGIEGSFSHLVLMQTFGSSCLCQGYPSFREAYEAVEKGEADLALLPIENCLIGPIEETINLLREGNLKIVGEARMRIEHSLLTLPGINVQELKRVLSHPKALAQCSRFFRSHPWIEAIPFYDTAGAAAHVAQSKKRGEGAIAHHLSAKIYGLEVLQSSLEDRADNVTRFCLLSQDRKS